ncbi:CoxG family protein [Sphingobium vermicomposti]|uniref:Carbon monoxide dehydrogenase subunit G n=1 Tax=Sphingobium vermicomposti TaxID=529005 RepID=A0A846M9B3_9SPHN|nr:SRPBCC family protein [Sphingobium vermicomposti]NIJ17828.1 carbon monoxide dehydrogenase subunit G [Sphingobium vermicomposti]
MPEVEHTTTVAASMPQVWNFVEDMDNWAPFLTGYQRHEKINRDESIWVVKGELGGLTRTAEFKVQVTEWQEPSRVTFVMQGVQEPVTGSGEFLATDLGGGADDASSAPAAAPASTGSWLGRLWDRLSRWLLRRVTNSVDVQAVKPAVSGGQRNTQITFRLNVQAGGATGPVLNLLLGPMLKPVAEDLAMKIARSVDSPG